VAQLYPQALGSSGTSGCHSPYPLLWAPEGTTLTPASRATGPRYIASARTAQKTSLQTVLLLLRVQLLLRSRDDYQPFPSNGSLCWFNSCFEQICHNSLKPFEGTGPICQCLTHYSRMCCIYSMYLNISPCLSMHASYNKTATFSEHDLPNIGSL
jgi:hypothetical protein